MITTKPVICLRASTVLVNFLKQLQIDETILRIFNVKKFTLEEDESLKFSEIMSRGLPVVSLAKHLKGDYNLNFSRCYNYYNLEFLDHIQSPDTITEQLKTFQLTNCQVILFDEDIGGGYLIKKLTKMFNDSYGVEVIPETFVKFDPKFEEVLDLKDFIYQYSSSSGLVVNSKGRVHRVPYMMNIDILEKFASIRPVYLDNFGVFCWVLSFLYHYYVTNNQTYMLDCYTQLTKVYKWKVPTNTESMKEFCLEYLKLYF
jgi:hypothetical protein